MLFGFETLLSKIGRNQRKVRCDYDQVRIERIHRLNITVDCEAANQAVRSERFARGYHQREIGGAAIGGQLVSLRCRHIVYDDIAVF